MNSPREKHNEFIKNNRVILKSQERFRSKKHNVFTGDVDKISLSANDDKRIQSIDSIERYVYGASKDLVCEKRN